MKKIYLTLSLLILCVARFSSATETTTVAIWGPDMLGGKPMRICLPLRDIKDGPESKRFTLSSDKDRMKTSKECLGCGPDLKVITNITFFGREYLPQDKIVRMFDATSAFGIAELVFGMWRGEINMSISNPYGGYYDPAGSLDKMGQITIRPHAGCGDKKCSLNAFFDPSDNSLNFPQFIGADGKRHYSVRSFDIVAHEAGHACLHGMCPIYLDPKKRTKWTLALHESFADMSALFATFKLAPAKKLETWCKDPGFCVGGVAARSIGDKCIRDIIEPRTGLKCYSHHDISKALTDFVCRAMQGIYKADKHLTPEIVITSMRRNVLRAVLFSQMEDNPFESVAKIITEGFPSGYNSGEITLKFSKETLACLSLTT